MVLIEHHIKYKEIHGVDETVFIPMSEHKKLHIRLRKEGKCNIPSDDLKEISIKANHRTEKWKKYSKEFNKTQIAKKLHRDYKLKSAEHFVFCESLIPNVVLWEDYTYNRITGHVSVSSYFTGNHGLKLKEVFV